MTAAPPLTQPAVPAPARSRPWLVADIGGTNARFGLVDAPGARPRDVCRLLCADHPDLASAARTYLERTGGARPGAACVAVAGPVEGDRIRLTNARWDCSAEDTRRELGLAHIEVVNDFAALALALPRLDGGDLLALGGPPPAARRPMAVLGPGTGLGVAGLLPAPGGGWVPVSGEGGHVGLSPATDLEIEVLRTLRAGQGTVTAECVLSGPGMTRLHGALARVHGGAAAAPLPAERICDTADEDPLCALTLEVFCALLGGFAGDCALTLGATGGVFVGGGIAPRIAEVLQRSDFRIRFESKYRMTDYVKDIATVLITAPTPALLGTAARLDQCLETTP
ncbi:glucokinase [Nocardiopsis sediminis]|uniref:Glucokinase n=1 Tax=Nocardiopsis sediminis TaxID=1778267 RepID=A0ABV8FRH2_9ACTN